MHSFVAEVNVAIGRRTVVSPCSSSPRQALRRSCGSNVGALTRDRGFLFRPFASAIGLCPFIDLASFLERW